MQSFLEPSQAVQEIVKFCKENNIQCSKVSVNSIIPYDIMPYIQQIIKISWNFFDNETFEIQIDTDYTSPLFINYIKITKEGKKRIVIDLGYTKYAEQDNNLAVETVEKILQMMKSYGISHYIADINEQTIVSSKDKALTTLALSFRAFTSDELKTMFKTLQTFLTKYLTTEFYYRSGVSFLDHGRIEVGFYQYFPPFLVAIVMFLSEKDLLSKLNFVNYLITEETELSFALNALNMVHIDIKKPFKTYFYIDTKNTDASSKLSIIKSIFNKLNEAHQNSFSIDNFKALQTLSKMLNSFSIETQFSNKPIAVSDYDTLNNLLNILANDTKKAYKLTNAFLKLKCQP